MSGSTEIVTRRSRTERPEREVHAREPDPPAVIIEPPTASISPEDALADAHRQLKESDKRSADARRQAREAEARARQAEAAAAQAAAGRTTDRATVVASAIDAAKAELANARAAKRLAREAGDLDAEIQADDVASAAQFRLQSATAESEYLKANPPAKPTPGPAGGNAGMSAAAQQWVNDHPAFNTDPDYQDAALLQHRKALRAGHRDGSPEYIDFIEDAMTEMYGDGHGQEEGARPVAQQPRQQQQRQAAPRGDAVPPSRNTGGNHGWKRIDTGVGVVEYQDRPGGQRAIRYNEADGTNLEEGARISRMTLADYVNDHITHAQEIAAGGRGDIIKGDGENFR